MQLEHRDDARTQRSTGERDTLSRHVAACPECTTPVADGQGLLCCPACGWVGQVA